MQGGEVGFVDRELPAERTRDPGMAAVVEAYLDRLVGLLALVLRGRERVLLGFLVAGEAAEPLIVETGRRPEVELAVHGVLLHDDLAGADRGERLATDVEHEDEREGSGDGADDLTHETPFSVVV